MPTISVEAEQQSSVEIEFALTAAEARAAADLMHQAARRKLGLERHWRFLKLIPPMLLIVGLAIGLAWGYSPAAWTGFGLASLALVSFWGGTLWLEHYERARVETLKNRHNLNQCWRIDAAGLHIRFGDRDHPLPWKQIAAVGYQKGYIYIYLDSLLYLLVPERAFLSQTQERRFINYLRAGTGKSQTRKTPGPEKPGPPGPG